MVPPKVKFIVTWKGFCYLLSVNKRGEGGGKSPILHPIKLVDGAGGVKSLKRTRTAFEQRKAYLKR